MSESTITNEAGVQAAVNAPELVTLYAADGEQIQVAPDKVERWLGRGFSLKSQAPADLKGDVRALGEQLVAAWLGYHDASAAKGAIDQAAQDVAHEALRLFCNACDGLHRAIHEAYPRQD